MSAPTASATLPRTAATSQAKTARPPRNWGNFGLVTPFLVFYILFLVGPLIYDVVLSFFNTSLVKGGLGSFAGFANYTELFQIGRAHV